MRHAVPDDGKPRLRAYLRERCGEDRDQLSAGDFSARQSVIIRFPDGSHVLFRHAFAVVDQDSQEMAVFTEHCGHHVFPLAEAELEVVQSIA